MAEKHKNVEWPPCQLMLTIEPGAGARSRLEAALEAATVAAVLIRPKAGDRLGAGEVKPLVDLAQDQGAVAILHDDAQLAKTLRADGVHLPPGLPGGSDVRERIAAARSILGGSASIGADAGTSRHAAMEAGEAGAEYVAFGDAGGTDECRRRRDELIAWWAAIFEVPCVALDMHTVEDVERADVDGADFAALTLPNRSAEDITALVGSIGERLSLDAEERGPVS